MIVQKNQYDSRVCYNGSFSIPDTYPVWVRNFALNNRFKRPQLTNKQILILTANYAEQNIYNCHSEYCFSAEKWFPAEENKDFLQIANFSIIYTRGAHGADKMRYFVFSKQDKKQLYLGDILLNDPHGKGITNILNDVYSDWQLEKAKNLI